MRVTTPNGAAESAIAISPADPDKVVAGTNGPGSGQKMWYSSNGGTSWSGPVSLPSGSCCDPTVGWSTDGAIAYTADLSGCGAGGCAVRFFRSTNFGQSWTKTVDLATTGSDKEYMHVDNHATSPHKDNVYVAWHTGNVQKFRRSTDMGLTFGSTLTLDGSNRGIGSDITSDAAGSVYFFYPSFNLQQIRVVKSTDGGATFAAPRTVANTNAEFDFPIPAMETRAAFIYNAADTDRSGGPFNNSVYVAWLDTSGPESGTPANNHSRIQVGYSRDGGNTWAVSTPHPTADINSVDRFNHWLSVDDQGRVHVIFYDTRHSQNRTGVDLYYTSSSDGGVSWSTAQRISAVTSPNINDSFEWGDYNGMDLVLDNIISIYTDNRDETGGSAQSIDVYAAAGFTGGGGENQPPAADFTFTTSGLTANFTDASTDSDGTIASRSWNFGDGTTSTATNPSKTYAAAGTYNVTLTVTDDDGATDSETRPVTVSAGGGDTLTNGVPVPNLSGATGSERRWTMAVPADASNLQFNIAGGSGDADLYVEFGSAPTTTSYDCRPYLNGNNETCTFATPQAGTWHVMLRGYSAYSGVTLTGSYGTGGGASFFENTTDYAINDNATIESPIAVSGRSGNAPSNLQVGVTIYHTYRGDLRVDLVAPDGSVYTLHNRSGGSADNLIGTYTVNASSEPANGSWKLRVNDNANQDTGTLDTWSLQF